MLKVCPNCKVEYKTFPSIDKKFCSLSCGTEFRARERYRKYKKNCATCGKEFLSKRPLDGGTYCSYKCRGLASRFDRIDRNGYWYVRVDDHPNSSLQGYIAEHHLVMEKKIGKYIEPGMVVHHVDGNKKNNLVENLRYMTDSDHKSLHAKERKGAMNGRFI